MKRIIWHGDTTYRDHILELELEFGDDANVSDEYAKKMLTDYGNVVDVSNELKDELIKEKEIDAKYKIDDDKIVAIKYNGDTIYRDHTLDLELNNGDSANVSGKYAKQMKEDFGDIFEIVDKIDEIIENAENDKNEEVKDDNIEGNETKDDNTEGDKENTNENDPPKIIL